MKRPSHATAVAYLALFIALGGSAYAVTQLPKNSVGAKQIKKNAVTTAKVKDRAVTESKIAADAVTGAKVAESTLGKVPSATTADSAATAVSATSAATAADASALGGISSAGFLQTSDIVFGSANPEILSIQPILTVPGAFNLTTSGAATAPGEFQLRFENVASATWFFHSRSTLLMLGPTGSTLMTLMSVLQETIVAYDATNPANHVVIECALRSGSPDNIFCTAQMSPAL
jgi:hypothetical protein